MVMIIEALNSVQSLCSSNGDGERFRKMFPD